MKIKKYSISIKNRVSERNLFRFDYCGNLKGKKILDIGSSNGWFEKYALLSGASETIGIEVDRGKIIDAQKNVPKAIFQFVSAEKMKFKNNNFDIIVLFDVLEHFKKENVLGIMKKCHSFLKIGGKLIISTPNLNIFSCIFDPAWYFGHRHFSKNDLSTLLYKSNFMVKKMETKGGFHYLFSMDLDYFFKWIFFLENPFREFLEKNDGLRNDKEKFVFIITEAVK